MLNLIKSILRTIRTIILSLILIVVVVFMVSNREVIAIHAYPLPFDIEMRAFLIMILFFILGMLFGFLAFSENMIGKSISNFKDRRKVKKLEKKSE